MRVKRTIAAAATAVALVVLPTGAIAQPVGGDECETLGDSGLLADTPDYAPHHCYPDYDRDKDRDRHDRDRDRSDRDYDRGHWTGSSKPSRVLPTL